MEDDGLTTDRSDPRLHQHRPDGQQEAYLILSEEERAKGFVRPLRFTYQHLACGALTTMSQAIAETYARQPHFYKGTMCVRCHAHFPLCTPDGAAAFVWEADGSPVGA